MPHEAGCGMTPMAVEAPSGAALGWRVLIIYLPADATRFATLAESRRTREKASPTNCLYQPLEY